MKEILLLDVTPLSMGVETLGKINTKTARREKEVKLAEGTDVLARTPDGKTLIATTPSKDGCKVQVIDPKTLAGGHEVLNPRAFANNHPVVGGEPPPSKSKKKNC